MIEAFFDDSGTHNGSQIILWGGVVGYSNFVEEMTVRWKHLLSAPCEGRSPIHSFHSSHLAASEGAFAGYTLAERDRTRYNFRQAILDAGLTTYAWAISATDWINEFGPISEDALVPAESIALGRSLIEIARAAEIEQQPLKFVFDQGRKSDHISYIIEQSLSLVGDYRKMITVEFGTVRNVIGLQAADLVSHEIFQYLCTYIENERAQTNPHLSSLIQNSFDAKVLILGAEEIRNLKARILE